MSILKMKKVTIGGLKSEKDDIMYLLQRMGAMEVTEIVRDAEEEKESVTSPKLLQANQMLDNIDDALAKIKPFVKKKGLAKPEFTLQQINEAGGETERLHEILSKMEEAEKEIATLKSEVSTNEKVISSLKPFAQLATPMDELGESRSTISMVGLIPNRSAKLLKEWDNDEFCYVEFLSEDNDNSYIFLVAYKNVWEKVAGDIRALGFAQIDLSNYSGLPRDVIAGCNKNISDLEAQLQQAKSAFEKMSSENEFLMLSYDYYNIQAQRLESEAKSDDTEYAFFVEGWVVANNVENLRKSVENLSPNCFMTDRDPLDDEAYPTALKNNKLVKPYEAVTDLYSPPDPRGFDPNGIMAPFFFIFVGMMISDAAYGIVLTIGAFLALKLMKPGEGMMSKIMKVLIMSGISTLIWGALFGSWFAFTPPEGMYWFAPMNDPIKMLVICYGLGIIHLFTAQIVAAYICFRDGDWMGAIFDNLFWLGLYVGLLLWLGGAFIAPLFKIGMWTSFAFGAGLILTQGRAKKNPIQKLISGVLSLYDISGFLSDVLSYSRLFALGLATGVVGMVINTLVQMTFGNIFLIPLGIVVFIGGHMFNIFINVLGAYVHDSRLQYIEFYGKFYQDGGQSFKPLALKTKHVRLG